MNLKRLLSVAAVLVISFSLHANADQSNYPAPDDGGQGQGGYDQGYGQDGDYGQGGCVQGCVQGGCCTPGFGPDRVFQPGRGQVQGGQNNIQIGNGSTVIFQVDPNGNVRQSALPTACGDSTCYQGANIAQLPWTPLPNNNPYVWGGCSVGCATPYVNPYYTYGGVSLPLYNTFANGGYRYYVYNRYGQGVLPYGYNPIPRTYAVTPQPHPYYRGNAYAPRGYVNRGYGANIVVRPGANRVYRRH